MIHIRKIIILVLLALGSATAFSQDSDRRDGNWWRSQSRPAQVNYMVGFFDGMELGHRFSYWSFANDRKAGESMKRVSASYVEYIDKYFNNPTSGQLVDGLDVFYADFRNRSILVHNAVWIVVNQVAGETQGRVDALIENWRRNSTK